MITMFLICRLIVFLLSSSKSKEPPSPGKVNVGIVRLSRQDIMTCSLSNLNVLETLLSEDNEMLRGFNLGDMDERSSLVETPVRSPIDSDLVSGSYLFLGLSLWVTMACSSFDPFDSSQIVIVFFIILKMINSNTIFTSLLLIQ